MFRDISMFDTLLNELRRTDRDWLDFDRAGSPWLTGIRSVSRGTFPPLNIGACADSIHVYVFAAGIDPQHLEVTLQQNLLTLSGRRQQAQGKDAVFYRRELFEGPFQRVITLPEDVDPDAVEASYQNGVLHIRIGRREEVKPRQIKIH